MLQTVSRSSVFLQKRKFQEPHVHKVVVPTTVCVKNPVTGFDEEVIVNTLKEEEFIDKHLRASDFALDVQLRSGVDLKDCGRYFTPSTPEEYVDVVSNASKYLQELQQPSTAQPTGEPIKEPIQEPSKTE